jgi:hypothetical protein
MQFVETDHNWGQAKVFKVFKKELQSIVNLPWVLSLQCMEFLDTIMLILWFLLHDSLKSTSKVMLAYTCQYNGGESND